MVLNQAKNKLYKLIVQELTLLLETAQQAANQAYETATNGQTVAENKYDTFGLEASYLAAGQSKRVAQCANDLKVFQALGMSVFDKDDKIDLFALVTIEDEQKTIHHYFMSPVSGGVKIQCDDLGIILITPASPLGKALFGLYTDDEFELLVAGSKHQYLVLRVE